MASLKARPASGRTLVTYSKKGNPVAAAVPLDRPRTGASACRHESQNQSLVPNSTHPRQELTWSTRKIWVTSLDRYRPSLVHPTKPRPAAYRRTRARASASAPDRAARSAAVEGLSSSSGIPSSTSRPSTRLSNRPKTASSTRTDGGAERRAAGAVPLDRSELAPYLLAMALDMCATHIPPDRAVDELLEVSAGSPMALLAARALGAALHKELPGDKAARMVVDLLTDA